MYNAGWMPEGLGQRFEPGWCMSSAGCGSGASCRAGAGGYEARSE